MENQVVPAQVYEFKGSVLRYGREVLHKSEKQAINNLLFQARMFLKLEPRTKLELSGRPKTILKSATPAEKPSTNI